MKLFPSLSSLPERFPAARKYLVAVSGGRDSVALLDVLVELGYRNLVVCHFNHRLRGRASAADARFVASLGKRYDLRVDTGSDNVSRLAKAGKLSIETAARNARHRFFFEVATRHRCHRIFFGHHADDQVESVLMHLFRGAGMGGVTGMRELTLLKPARGMAARKSLELIRPLLKIRRIEIDDYVVRRKLSWREDASNATTEHLRNRIRSMLMPTLVEAFQRDVSPMVHRFAEIVREEDDCLEALAGVALLEVQSSRGTLSTKQMLSLHPALQRRVLRQWFDLQEFGGIGFDEIESVRRLLEAERPAKVNLPNSRHVRRRAGQLFVE